MNLRLRNTDFFFHAAIICLLSGLLSSFVRWLHPAALALGVMQMLYLVGSLSLLLYVLRNDN